MAEPTAEQAASSIGAAAREAGDGGVVRGHVAVEALLHCAAGNAARDLPPELGAVGPVRLPPGQQVPGGRTGSGAPEHLRRFRSGGGGGARDSEEGGGALAAPLLFLLGDD